MACKRSAVRSRLPPPKERRGKSVSMICKATGSSRSPSSRGLGHHPFTVSTGVRIPLGTPVESGCGARSAVRQQGLSSKYRQGRPARLLFLRPGGIAQLGERLHGMQEVSGSIPLTSTKKRRSTVGMCQSVADKVALCGFFCLGFTLRCLAWQCRPGLQGHCCRARQGRKRRWMLGRY